ncbi:MAG TPA: EAL domain-containing protein [Gammaproteobacteria bacterium]|nr:EAL domain-containing protein [Gammaproteobacteria bacterium]
MRHLAHSLNIEVIAEGVETEAQMEYLKQRNCEYAQGFYLALPCSAQDMLKILQTGVQPQQYPPGQAVPF